MNNLINKTDKIEAVRNEYEAEFTDLPDIPRYYYEKVVGKMAHEINMLREQLESADAVSREVYDKRTQADEEIIDSYRQEFQRALSAYAVQGEWIGLAECSVCGKQALDFINGYVEGIEYLPNYCPNCGARMKQE